MPRPDEGLIHEWLDGELSPDEAARVERLVAEDPEWGAAAAEARGLVAASSRILGALDAVPGDVMPQGSRAAPREAVGKRTGFTVRPWMKVAAGLVLVAGTAYTLREQATAPLAEQEVALSAPALERAPLEQATIGPQSSVPAVGPPSRPVPTISEPRARQAAGGDAAGNAAGVASAVVGDISSSAVRRADTSVAVTSGVAAEQNATAQGAAAPTPVPQRLALEERARAEAGARSEASTRAMADPASRDRATDLARERAEVADAVRPAAPPPSVSAAPTASLRSAASGVSAKALSVRALEGCWRTETAAGADSVLTTPMIVRTIADSLVIVAGPAARPATVVRTEDALRGVMDDAAGVRVAFRATRITCPAVRETTPSPR